MIRRTYACPDCETVFAVECNSDDPDPPCPNPDCDKVLEWRPTSFAIGGSIEGKAVAHTQQILEQDYGLTNYKDNAQPGESGIVRRHETKVETELVEQEVREQMRAIEADPQKTAQFWGGSAGQATTMQSMTGQSLIQMAKVGPQATDPIAALHGLAKKGNISRHPSSMISEGYRADMSNPARKAKGS